MLLMLYQIKDETSPDSRRMYA